MTELLQVIVVGIGTGASFSLLGIGLVLVYRTTGVLNFTAGAFAVLGGLVMTSLVTTSPGLVAAVASVTAVAAIGALTAPVALGLRNRRTMISSLIVTVGLTLIIQAVSLLIWGDTPRSYPPVAQEAWAVGGVLIEWQYLLVAGSTMLVTGLLAVTLRYTALGNALVACADSEIAAELVGLNVRRLGVLVFALAAALGALAGVLLTPISSISFDSDVSLAINGFAAAAFGGLVSVTWALAGGIILGIAQAMVVGYVDPQYELTISLLLLLVLMAWRSQREHAA